jgi:hypothetical protein
VGDEPDGDEQEREQYMTSWSFLEAASQLLPLDEREAVLGDLTEAEESPRQMLVEVLGLVVRRHLALWKSWQPWLAAFGLVLPSSFLLMAMSVSLSSTFQRMHWQMVTEHDAVLNLMAVVFLLISWSWAAGFVVSFISRRTLWVSGIACLMPCLFCLARFRMETLPRFSLFLFILPAAFGVWHGMRIVRIRRSFATVMAVAVTMLMILTWNREFWLPNVALLWPIWYIAAMALRNATNKGKRMTA